MRDDDDGVEAPPPLSGVRQLEKEEEVVRQQHTHYGVDTEGPPRSVKARRLQEEEEAAAQQQQQPKQQPQPQQAQNLGDDAAVPRSAARRNRDDSGGGGGISNHDDDNEREPLAPDSAVAAVAPSSSSSFSILRRNGGGGGDNEKHDVNDQGFHGGNDGDNDESRPAPPPDNAAPIAAYAVAEPPSSARRRRHNNNNDDGEEEKKDDGGNKDGNPDPFLPQYKDQVRRAGPDAAAVVGGGVPAGSGGGGAGEELHAPPHGGGATKLRHQQQRHRQQQQQKLQSVGRPSKNNSYQIVDTDATVDSGGSDNDSDDDEVVLEAEAVVLLSGRESNTDRKQAAAALLPDYKDQVRSFHPQAAGIRSNGDAADDDDDSNSNSNIKDQGATRWSCTHTLSSSSDHLPDDFKGQAQPAGQDVNAAVRSIQRGQLLAPEAVVPLVGSDVEQASMVIVLPDFKDQSRPATNIKAGMVSQNAAAGAAADNNNTGPEQNTLQGPNFKDQAQLAGPEEQDARIPSVYAVAEEEEDAAPITPRQTTFPPGINAKNTVGPFEGSSPAAAVHSTVFSAINNSDNNTNADNLHSNEIPPATQERKVNTQQQKLGKRIVLVSAIVLVGLAMIIPVVVVLVGGRSSNPTVTPSPTLASTPSPTLAPTVTSPTLAPTAPPTLAPTVTPTVAPTAAPTRTAAPTPLVPNKIKASDGAANDYFGWSVAIYRDTIVIGAVTDDTGNGENSGSANVYTLSGAVWTEQAKLTASDGAEDDNFGYSVAMGEGTIVIGAPGGNTENGENSGSAFVYIRSGTVWTEQAKLTASDGNADDTFGISVTIDNDTIVIGAAGDITENGIESGSAYVYIRSGTVWTEQTKLTASDGAADALFGYSVSMDGGTIVTGAWGDATENGENSGSAYVYSRSGTVWTEQAKLTASDGAPGDEFGDSVAISGDTIVIGAYQDDNENGEWSGSAYVYTISGTVWSEQAKLTASGGAAGDQFGTSVAIHGDTIVVGAKDDDTENDPFSGSAYVYTRSGTVWTEQAKLIASDGAANDEFGNSVAMDGDTFIIGAWWDDTENGEDSGSAYIFN